MTGAGSLVYNFFGVIVFLMVCKKFSFFTVFFLSVSSLNLLAGPPASSEESSSDERPLSPCAFVMGALFELTPQNPARSLTFRQAERLAGHPLQGVTPNKKQQELFGSCSLVFVPKRGKSPKEELDLAARLLKLQSTPADPFSQPQKDSDR